MRARARSLLGLIGLVTLLGVVLLSTSCGSETTADVSAAAEERVVRLGEAVYQANCTSCHGASGEGEPNWQSRKPDGTLPAPPHDASGHTWHHADEELLRIIRLGGQAAYGGAGFVSGMPAFGDTLSDEEITAVLAYLKTLWGDEERAYQAERSGQDAGR